MPRSNLGKRALGPYAERGKFAVVYFDDAGARWRRYYDTEDEAMGPLMEYNGGIKPAKREAVPVRRRMTMIYFIRSATGPIKIGIAADVCSRLYHLQTASARRLRLLTAIPGGRSEERALHEMFSEERMKGEWFRPSRRLLGFIAECEAAAAAALAGLLTKLVTTEVIDLCGDPKPL